MKKTKIVATLSDFKANKEYIQQLVDAGANVVRINTAHVDFEGAEKIIKAVREVTDRVAILLDTKGPEIRTYGIENPITVKNEDIIKVRGCTKKAVSSQDTLYTSYEHIVKDVPVGKHIMIDDGDIELKVTEKNKDYLTCIVIDGGTIKNRKSINIPNVSIDLPAVTKRDREFIRFGIEQKIDFIAHSFVRRKEDITEIQQILDKADSPIEIIAKIENQEGVDNLDEILDVTFGVMVARGDLGIEIPAEQIPVISRQMISHCIERKKIVIMATQMLHSMIENPRPTRAEVSDVAVAVFLGVDAIMLSGESAQGPYGIEAVNVMARVAQEVEANYHELGHVPEMLGASDISMFLAKAGVTGAAELGATAIVTDTITGAMPLRIASFRSDLPVFARCYREELIRQMAIVYGVDASYQEMMPTKGEYIQSVANDLLDKGRVEDDDLLAILGGKLGVGSGTTFLEFITPTHALKGFKK